MNQDQLFEVFHALVIDHIAVDSHDPLKVGRGFDECFEIEVWRYGLEGRTWSCGRHGRRGLRGTFASIGQMNSLRFLSCDRNASFIFKTASRMVGRK